MKELGLRRKFARSVERFIRNTKAATSISDWIMGIVAGAVLGVGVAIPVVVNTVNEVIANLTGTTKLVVETIPVIVAVAILLIFLGRR